MNDNQKQSVYNCYVSICQLLDSIQGVYLQSESDIAIFTTIDGLKDNIREALVEPLYSTPTPTPTPNT